VTGGFWWKKITGKIQWRNKKAIFCLLFKKGDIFCHITDKIFLPKTAFW
jgi:hypothetical protein